MTPTDSASILVVDDEKTVRELFVITLQEAGYSTVEAKDGASALAAVARERPALILLDITMPGINGMDVVKAMRASDSGATIPIILVTALAQIENRVRGLEAGANDYIAKPVALDELVARVAAQLRATRAWATASDAGARVAAERERARFTVMTGIESALDASLRAASDEEGVFSCATSLLASVGGVSVASIALVEPAGLLRVHSVHTDARQGGVGPGTVRDSVEQARASIAWALETGDVFVQAVEQPGQSIDGSRPEEVPRVANEAVIPIRSGGLTIGVLALQSDVPDFFGDAEIKMLERAAAMVARRLGEIDRLERERALTRALEEERLQGERFGALSAQVDRALAPIFRADGLFRAVCELPVEMGICPFAWFGLVQGDRDGPRMRLVASAGRCDRYEALIAQIRKIPTAYVGLSAMATNRPTVVNDILGDPGFHRTHDVLRAAGLRSMMFVPIFFGLRPAAGLVLFGEAVGTFGDREVALFQHLGSNAAQRLAAIESERPLPRSREGIRTIARRLDDCGAAGPELDPLVAPKPPEPRASARQREH